MTTDSLDQDAFIPPEPDALSALLPAYGVQHLIAAGGMGAVYAGLQRDLDRPVAIKLLAAQGLQDAEAVERFRTEAKAMARLNHPNVPQVYDFAVLPDCYVLIMELIAGENVYSLLHQDGLSSTAALRLFTEIADAVQYAHSKSIIHGDIKPGNIILNDEGHAKLVDFGLARLSTGAPQDEHADWIPMGTPEYAAPELFVPHTVPDHRADIYALGVVLHELLTGAVPEGDFTLPAAGLQLDPRVDDIIARCMEVEPAARWKSAAQIRDMMQDIISGKNIPEAALPRVATRAVPAAVGQRRVTAPTTATAVKIVNPRALRRTKKRKSSSGGLILLLLLAVGAWAAWQYHFRLK